MNILSQQIDAYLENLHASQHEVLREMEQRAQATNFPIVGPQVGRLFFILASLMQPLRIFELGSGFGYSALWFALGAGPEATIYCTDRSTENMQRARKYFDRAGLLNPFELRDGDALQLLHETDGAFDIILMDIDKHEYPGGFDAAWPRVRRGGLFIVDNVLWKGKVAEPAEQADATTRAVQELNQKAFATADATCTILPVRDGVLLAMKN